MACREYEDGLRGLAEGSLAPREEAEVRAHLAACAACREALDEEKRLVATIEQALREEMNAEVPATLAARIRAGIAEDAARPEAAWWRWVALAGAAVAAALVMASVLRRTETPSMPGNERQRATVAEASNSIPPATALTAPGRRDRKSVAESIERSGGPRRRSALPEVLVPAEERVAFARFAESLRAGRGGARRMLSDGGGSLAKPIQIVPMEMAELEVKPLEADGSKE